MRNLRSMSLSIATVALLITGFAGCSSSSGSSDTGDGSTTIGGKAVDGYLNEAIVCLDLDLNGNCSVANEPIANTDALGAYTLTVTAAQQAHANFDIAPIIVYGGIDNDTGKRFEGFLQAPNDGSAINITPLTTLVQKSVEIDTAAGTLTADQIKVKIEEAKAKVKTILGLSAGTALDADPVAQKLAGNDELIAASLSLQKSIQTLAKAAASDSASTGKSEAELVEDMFEAFANGLADIDESVTANQSLDALLDATTASTANADLVPPKAHAAIETAKLVGAKVREAFDGMSAGGIDAADAMKNITMLIEQDLTNFETEFANYDVSTGVAFATAVDLNISDDGVFDVNYDFRTNGFTFEFNEVLDLNLTTTEIATLVALLDDTFQPWDLYESSNTYSDITAFANVYAKIRAIQDSWVDEEQLLEAQNSTDAAAITIPSSFYSLYVEIENNLPYYAYTQVFFQSDLTISFDNYGYNGTSWDIDSSGSTDYLLTTSGWTAEGNALPFTVNADNSLSLTTDNTKASITSLNDIGNTTLFIPSIGLEVAMPTGSAEQYVRLEKTADTYYLDDNATDVNGSNYLSLESFITTSCEGNYGIVGNETAYLTFASCTTGQTSGNIVKVLNSGSFDANNTVGTWAIETINEKSILVLTPDNPYEFSYGEDLSYPIYSMQNGVVYRGNKDPLGNVSLFPVYNQIAIEAIKTALEAP